jgi:hypothetical protein
MQKILLVINAEYPDTQSANFACKIAKSNSAKLSALIVENMHFDYTPSTGLEAPSYFSAVSPANANAIVTADKEQIIRLFKEQCQLKGVSHEILTNGREPLQQVIFESRFSDLLIVDPQITLFEGEEQLPSHFVKEILAKAECPVLLAPEKFDEVEEVVFCYDRSASSVFAFKQFTYLMPQFKAVKVRVLEVNRKEKEEFNEADRKIMEWVRANYPNVCYYSLAGNANDELFAYLFMTKNRLIVLGAYGRSMLSNFLRKSNADILMRTVDLPLFIAHH